jgi:hypothetical protein
LKKAATLRSKGSSKKASASVEAFLIWRFGDLAIWRFGDLAIWRFGDLAIWRYCDLRFSDLIISVPKGQLTVARQFIGGGNGPNFLESAEGTNECTVRLP